MLIQKTKFSKFSKNVIYAHRYIWSSDTVAIFVFEHCANVGEERLTKGVLRPGPRTPWVFLVISSVWKTLAYPYHVSHRITVLLLILVSTS